MLTLKNIRELYALLSDEPAKKTAGPGRKSRQVKKINRKKRK